MDKRMLSDADAAKLLAEFKAKPAFRDHLLTDPAAAAASLGVTLGAEAVAEIRKDAQAIREETARNSTQGVLIPTLVKYIRWTS